MQTAAVNEQIERLVSRLREEPPQLLTGSREGRLEVLQPERIIRAGEVTA